MELSDYIYVFSKYLLQEAVKETICVENWENSDFDSRYKEYCEKYLELKSKYLSTEKSVFQKDMKQATQLLVKNYVTKTKDKLFALLEAKKKLNKDTMELIIKRLLKYDDDNTVNIELLKEIRQIEEEYLC